VRPWDQHPPWAHWSFYVVWGIAGTLGPIGLIVGLLSGSSSWLVGAALCALWVADLVVDWLVVRRLMRNENWTPWEPTWKWLAK
jgi:hypothetical protein